MFGLLKKIGLQKNNQKPIIVKAEIDYDKLADKLAQAMVKYQEGNAITEESIKKAVLGANKEFHDIENNKPLTQLSGIMRAMLLCFYGFVFLSCISACIVYSYDYAIHGVDIKERLTLLGAFASIAGLATVAFIVELKTKSNNSVQQHFSYVATMAALLLAILAL